ncbi:hypothetical protein ACFLQU_02950 [Verrucomicrobiota bacterium]
MTKPTGHPDVEVAIQARIGTSLKAFPSLLKIPTSDRTVTREFRLRLPRGVRQTLDPAKLSVPEAAGMKLSVGKEPGANGLIVRATFGPPFLSDLARTGEIRLDFGLPGVASAEVKVRPAQPDGRAGAGRNPTP